MSEQDGTKAPALQRPANDEKEAWKAYWKEQGQPWRTEQEIDEKRQKYLDERRAIVRVISHLLDKLARRGFIKTVKEGGFNALTIYDCF